jgi:hypothetical protein
MFDAMHVQNVQLAATMKVAEISISKREPQKTSGATLKLPAANSSLPFEFKMV